MNCLDGELLFEVVFMRTDIMILNFRIAKMGIDGLSREQNMAVLHTILQTRKANRERTIILHKSVRSVQVSTGRGLRYLTTTSKIMTSTVRTW